MRDHTELKAFDLADEVAVEVYRVTRSFPKTEIYGMVAQMRRAAVSVPSNIVEGCARNTRADYRRFLEIAFGSLRELHYQLDLACRLDYMGDHDFTVLDQLCTDAEKVLGGLLRSQGK